MVQHIIERVFFQLTGPFTILAPSDFAFSKLGSSVMTSLSKNTAQLKKILEYHVLSEFVLGPQINGNVSKKTVEGQTLTITGLRGQVCTNHT